MNEIVRFYEEIYGSIYEYIINGITNTQQEDNEFKLVSSASLKNGENKTAYTAINNLQMKLDEELKHHIHSLNEPLSKQPVIHGYIDFRSNKLDLSINNNIIDELFDKLRRLHDTIADFIEDNKYILAYLYAVERLVEIDFEPDDIKVSATSKNYISFITISTYPDREDKFNLRSISPELLIDSIGKLNINDTDKLINRLKGSLQTKEKFVNVFSSIIKISGNDREKVSEFFFNFLHFIYYEMDVEEWQLIKFFLEYLIKCRKIIEMIVFRLIVDTISLPVALNMKYNEMEYDIIVIINENGMIKPKIIEVTTKQNINVNYINNRTYQKINKLQGYSLEPKDIIWLIPKEIEMCNTLSIYRFLRSPQVILQYLYR